MVAELAQGCSEYSKRSRKIKNFGPTSEIADEDLYSTTFYYHEFSSDSNSIDSIVPYYLSPDSPTSASRTKTWRVAHPELANTDADCMKVVL